MTLFELLLWCILGLATERRHNVVPTSSSPSEVVAFLDGEILLPPPLPKQKEQ